MRSRDRLLLSIAGVFGLVAGTPRSARAVDIEVPVLVVEAPDEGGAPESSDDLDLANLVTSAAKTSTTVQEAPAIITIVTEEELEDRHPLFLTDIVDSIPGFNRLDAFYGIFPQILARGVLQAVLPLHDEFSMFDPVLNVMSVQRGVPLELVKRIETISGPGGVLWGANSFLGVVNVITKNPEDVDGVQASAGYGDGEGNRTNFRAWAMGGVPRLFRHDDWGLLLHVSYENFQGPTYIRPGNQYSSQLPNANSVNLYGPILESNPQRSTVLNADLKLVLGSLTLQLSTPYQSRYWSGSLAGETAVDYVPKENQSRVNAYERYLLADYKRITSTTSSANVRGYFIQFVREFAPLLGGMPSAFLPSGVAFTAKPTGYRAGGSFDGSAQLASHVSVLYGVEAFHEWVPDTSTATRQGGGSEIDFSAPMNVAALPFPCPRIGSYNAGMVTTTSLVPGCPLTFLFESSRSTVGGFADLQIRPSKRLVLDGGVRLQAAPELRSTDVGYGLTPTFSAAAVYEVATDLHLKVNYAEGFRPPVFNNTNSNGESVQIDGTADLELETSRAVQFELNGRLLRGRMRIRELDLRLDYAYTTLDNFITFVDGRYINSSPRDIHSAELLAKLYLHGGARVELGYTFNRIGTSDKGAFVTMPENWFNLMTVNPITSRLDVATALHVYGSFEDPNRRVEARGLTVDESGLPSAVGGTVAVQPWEMVIDREPPAAEVQVALRWRPVDALELQATVYNAFNNRRPAYDNSNDLEARIEITPARFEGFRFFSSATYAF